jgi:tetratricopeptide (TPR) repeat protein
MPGREHPSRQLRAARLPSGSRHDRIAPGGVGCCGEREKGALAMVTMQVFLSHSSADKDVAERVVTALRRAGADVWFDEHNLGATQLLDEIQRQLRARPVFIVLLSKAAFASDWVKRECKWAFNIQLRDPSHIILPVVIAPIDPDAFDDMLYLEDFKRVEGPNHTVYAEAEMIERTLRLLALTPAGQAPAPATPQPAESVDDLMTQGKALAAQNRWTDALPFFQRATDRDPRNADVWGHAGWMLNELKRYSEAATAYDRSVALNDQQAWVWYNRGNNLNNLSRHEEALAAFERALALDPTDVNAWGNKGWTLNALGRYEEALVACDRALALNPNHANNLGIKANALYNLGRIAEALAAYERVLALDPTDVSAWYNKGVALNSLGRREEELVAYERALALDPTYADAWGNKGWTLNALGRYEEALVACDRALSLNPSHANNWSIKASVLRNLRRTAEAEEAERRAKELGG